MSKPAPAKPGPIPPDPARDGAYQVVVSFRSSVGWPPEALERYVREELAFLGTRVQGGFADLDVATRVIGAQGEASQLEGTGP